MALLVTLGAPGLAPAGAASPLIVSPRGDALVTSKSVRVVVRRQAGAKTRVRVGRRDVTARFRVRGRQLVGRLSRRDHVRYGRNTLAVVSRRAGKAKVTRARSFFFLQRNKGFLRVRLRGSNPVRLRMDVVSGAPRLHLIRRQRTVRVRLNGRSVGNALVAASGTRWTTLLSASHGLRYGVNRLRVFVAEPRAGRYISFSRRFRVRRNRPLAAAGLDHRTRPKARVRLGGRHRAARGGRLRYRWTLVKRPRGSRARISGRARAHPMLVPDRPGRYLARVSVSEHKRGRASASQVTGTSYDQASVSTGPAASLLSLSANAGPGGNRGVQTGEPGINAVFHAHTGPPGTIQWLELDRQSITEEMANTYCCADPDAISRLTQRAQSSAADRLVVVTLPPTRTTLSHDQYDEFNQLLAAIGVDPLSDEDLDRPGQQIVAIGVPTGGKGSGSVIRRHTTTGTVDLPRLGWLMPDGDLNAGYRFQPLRVSFNTSSQSTPTSNTMTFGSQPPVTSPPVDVGADGAFHFVEVDPTDLSVVRNLSFANDAAGRADLNTAIAAASELDDIGNLTGRGNYVALQSIGRFAPANPGWDTSGQVASPAENLAAIGANPHYFNYRSPSYAFFGGAHLGARGAAQSNAGIVVDATVPGKTQSGKLSGEARMNPDGFFALPTGASTANPADSLYDVIFNTEGLAFPYTTGPDADDYRKAMAYISGQLGDPAIYDYWRDFSPPSGPRFTTNIRDAYLGLPEYDRWDDARAALHKIRYPGAAAGACQGPDAGGNKPGFTLTQFCQLRGQLVQEFVALVDSKDFIDRLEAAVSDAAGLEKDRLHTTYQIISDAVDKPNGDIAAPILSLIEALAELADLAEVVLAPEVAVASELAAESIDLASAVSSDGTSASSKPIGQTLSEDVAGLGANIEGSVATAAGSLASIRATAMSDWGRLQALANQDHVVETKSTAEVADQISNASGRYFSSALIQDLETGGRYRAFRIYTDGTGSGGGPNPVDCRYKYRGAPTGAWVPFLYELDQWSSLVYAWPGGTYSDFPPQDILQQMFASTSQESPINGLGNGYGIDKTSWFWQQADQATSEFRQFDDCTFGD